MTEFKCKICGGTLEFGADETVATCEYCGTKQTLPKLDDEKKANLFEQTKLNKAIALVESNTFEESGIKKKIKTLKLAIRILNEISCEGASEKREAYTEQLIALRSKIKRKRKWIAISIVGMVILCFFSQFLVLPVIDYYRAESAYVNNEYDKASRLYSSVLNARFLMSGKQENYCLLQLARSYYQEKRYDLAVSYAKQISKAFYDVTDDLFYQESCYCLGLERESLIEDYGTLANYEHAVNYFELAGMYKDAEEKAKEIKYRYVTIYYKNHSFVGKKERLREWEIARAYLSELKSENYKDSAELSVKLFE